jgi:hypothetical protein
VGRQLGWARVRVERAEVFARENGLGDVFDTLSDPKALVDVLASSDAALAEVDRTSAAARFHAQLLDGTPSTNVTDGLREAGAPRRSLYSEYVSEFGGPRIDVRRVASRGARRVGAAELRREMVATEPTNWRSGLTTSGGRPTDVDDATGARERFELEQIEAQRRSIGLL